MVVTKSLFVKSAFWAVNQKDGQSSMDEGDARVEHKLISFVISMFAVADKKRSVSLCAMVILFMFLFTFLFPRRD